MSNKKCRDIIGYTVVGMIPLGVFKHGQHGYPELMIEWEIFQPCLMTPEGYSYKLCIYIYIYGCDEWGFLFHGYLNVDCEVPQCAKSSRIFHLFMIHPFSTAKLGVCLNILGPHRLIIIIQSKKVFATPKKEYAE